jgi:hypothetical protein
MLAGLSRARTLLTYFLLLAGVSGVLSIPLSPAGLGLQPFQGSTTSTACTVSVESSLTVHVVANGRPLPSATVLLNGTFVCNGLVYPSNFSGATDSDGNVAFGVVPDAKYNVTVIPPRSLAQLA